MGLVRTVRGEDGRPYISLEDLIKEIENVKKSSSEFDTPFDRPNFIDVVIKTLNQIEEEYYDKFLFRKNENDDDNS